MIVAEEIQSAVKSKRAIVGYRRSVKFLKTGEAKIVIIADNIPDSMSAEMKRNAEVAGAKLEVFDGGSRDLGTACGKPFPVAAMVIKG